MAHTSALAAVLGGQREIALCGRLLAAMAGRAGQAEAEGVSLACREVAEDGFRVRIRPAGPTGQAERQSGRGDRISRVNAVIGWRGRGGRPLFTGEIRSGALAVAFDGALGSAARLREAALERGGMLQGGGDAELIAAALAASEQKTTINRLLDVSRQLEGGFSLLVMDEDRLIGLRDPQGRRPLWLGQAGEARLLASEREAIREAGGVAVREVEPGELVILERGTVQGIRPFLRQPQRGCLLEPIHLCHPGGAFGGAEAHPLRQRIGERLAGRLAERLAEGAGEGAVLALGAAAEPVAAGFARRSGLLLERLRGDQASAASAVAGRRAVLVGTVLDSGRVRAVAGRLRAQGAREVCLVLAAPVAVASCLYGVDLEEDAGFLELRNRNAPEVLRAFLGVDAVEALEAGELLELAGGGWCTGCMEAEREGAAAPVAALVVEVVEAPGPVLTVPLAEKAAKVSNQLGLFGK